MAGEHERLTTESAAWRRWGPYLSERSWGTVREDYSADGSAWSYLVHDHARSRAYRWNEDGLAGFCDDHQLLCFALALWNGQDSILKERLFGLSGLEGNHGEDVKEVYFYLDSTPTHSYCKMLYRYPQAAFPYSELAEENRRRGRAAAEFELLDTGVFDGNRFFDVEVEYAKAGPDDVLIRVTAHNRGPQEATLHLLPTLWFRNTWSWGRDGYCPTLCQPGWAAGARPSRALVVEAQHRALGSYTLHCEGAGALLFTENETNLDRLFGVPNRTPYVKDAFHRYVVQGEEEAVNPQLRGTKAAAHYVRTVPGGGSVVLRLRLRQETRAAFPADARQRRSPFSDYERLLTQRQREADSFYDALHPPGLDPDQRRVQRQAFAGLLWSKQFYHFDVAQWLDGDPGQPSPPRERKRARNREWRHLNAADVLSMPDKWEYPWFASWDLAFHCISLALVDSDFAKNQLVLLLREWYQHPNGDVPSYEWSFGDVDPPVFAWAAWRVYTIEGRRRGYSDRMFLERVFHKLLLNFTWWVNRKDSEGNNVFEGGFLGLDNIGVFDRSAPLPTGGFIEQSDGTTWMAMYCLSMMNIALELAHQDPVYEDIATKFFEHFMYIAAAMNSIGSEDIPLWNEADGFFYDVLRLPNGDHFPLTIRSLVGLIPLLAVETVDPETCAALPEFRGRLEWFLENRPELANLVSHWMIPGAGERRLLALVRGHRMKQLLHRALDETEFLSDYGIRSVSRFHQEHPYVLQVNGSTYAVAYEPAESHTAVFGGNSNWRGPVWFPINYLLIEALQKFHHYYSDDFRVECPTGSGCFRTLDEIADELSTRLIRLFTLNGEGRRPFNGSYEALSRDPLWRDYILFHEYFHGDTGAGLGASHQTGWTALVAKLIDQQGMKQLG